MGYIENWLRLQTSYAQVFQGLQTDVNNAASWWQCEKGFRDV